MFSNSPNYRPEEKAVAPPSEEVLLLHRALVGVQQACLLELEPDEVSGDLTIAPTGDSRYLACCSMVAASLIQCDAGADSQILSEKVIAGLDEVLTLDRREYAVRRYARPLVRAALDSSNLPLAQRVLEKVNDASRDPVSGYRDDQHSNYLLLTEVAGIIAEKNPLKTLELTQIFTTLNERACVYEGALNGVTRNTPRSDVTTILNGALALHAEMTDAAGYAESETRDGLAIAAMDVLVARGQLFEAQELYDSITTIHAKGPATQLMMVAQLSAWSDVPELCDSMISAELEKFEAYLSGLSDEDGHDVARFKFIESLFEENRHQWAGVMMQFSEGLEMPERVTLAQLYALISRMAEGKAGSAEIREFFDDWRRDVEENPEKRFFTQPFSFLSAGPRFTLDHLPTYDLKKQFVDALVEAHTVSELKSTDHNAIANACGVLSASGLGAHADIISQWLPSSSHSRSRAHRNMAAGFGLQKDFDRARVELAKGIASSLSTMPGGKRHGRLYSNFLPISIDAANKMVDALGSVLESGSEHAENHAKRFVYDVTKLLNTAIVAGVHREARLLANAAFRLAALLPEESRLLALARLVEEIYDGLRGHESGL